MQENIGPFAAGGLVTKKCYQLTKMIRSPFSSLKCLNRILDYKLLLINQQDYEPVREFMRKLGNYYFPRFSKSSVLKWIFCSYQSAGFFLNLLSKSN